MVAIVKRLVKYIATIGLLIGFFRSAPAVTIPAPIPAPMAEQATYAYDADPVHVASDNALTGFERLGQPVPTFGLVAKTVAARAGAGAGDEMVTVFSGVHAEHPQLGNALQGSAVPWGGHSDPVLRNAWDNRSIFTSWTTDQATAVRFATENGAGGVCCGKRFLDPAS